MTALKDLITTLQEILNLKIKNEKAIVYIGGKYLFIRQPKSDDTYFIEL